MGQNWAVFRAPRIAESFKEKLKEVAEKYEGKVEENVLEYGERKYQEAVLYVPTAKHRSKYEELVAQMLDLFEEFQQLHPDLPYTSLDDDQLIYEVSKRLADTKDDKEFIEKLRKIIEGMRMQRIVKGIMDRKQKKQK